MKTLTLRWAARTAFLLPFIALQIGPASALAYGGGIPVIVPPPPSVAEGQVLGASAYNFNSHLKFGQSGQDVTELQKILIAAGLLKVDGPTGYFGPLTLAAVKQYQAQNNVETTGFVGDLTLALLNQGSTPVAVQTEHSKTVAWLLTQLAGALEGMKRVLALSAST